MTSNKVMNVVGAAVTVMLAMSPGVTGAAGVLGDVNANVNAGGVGLSAHAQFCAAVGVRALDIRARLVDIRTKLETRRAELTQETGERDTEHDAAVKSDREKEDDGDAADEADIEDKATTSAEKQAVVQFKADVAAALEARRATDDAAKLTFRTKLKAAIAARKAAVDAATNRFAYAVQAALDRAKSNCAAGQTAEQVSQTFRTSVETARAQLRADMQAVTKLGAQVRTLVETRQAAHTKAQVEFKAALEAARVRLQAAFAASANTNVGGNE